MTLTSIKATPLALTILGAGLTVYAGFLATQPGLLAFIAAPTLIAFVALFITVARRPLWLFPFVGALSLLVYAVGIAGAQVIAADGVVALILLVWGVSRSRQPISSVGWTVLIPLIALIAICVVTLPVSPNEKFGVVKIVQRIEFLLFLAATIALLRDHTWMRRSVDAYIFASTLVAIATLQFAAVHGVSRGGDQVLFYGKNGIGSFLCMSLPLVAARLLFKASPHRIRWALVALVMIGGLLVSGSRGAWIGSVIGIGVLTAFKNRAALMRYIIVSAVLLAVLNALLPNDLTRSSQYNPSNLLSTHANVDAGGTALSRVVLWRDGLNLIASHPLLGVGVGGYVTYDTYQGDPFNFNTTDPHNAIIYFWAELGTVGLVAFLWTIAAIFRAANLARRTSLGSPDYWLAAGCLSAIISYLVFTLTEPIWIRGDGLAFFLLVGVVTNLASDSVRRSRDTVFATTASGLSLSAGAEVFS